MTGFSDRPCKIWPHAKVAGYGVIKVRGRIERVHRLTYLLEHGEIPPGINVHHLCENKACYEITHLEGLTRAEHDEVHYGSTCRSCGSLDWLKRRDGKRYCRTCQQRRNKNKVR